MERPRQTRIQLRPRAAEQRSAAQLPSHRLESLAGWVPQPTTAQESLFRHVPRSLPPSQTQPHCGDRAGEARPDAVSAETRRSLKSHLRVRYPSRDSAQTPNAMTGEVSPDGHAALFSVDNGYPPTFRTGESSSLRFCLHSTSTFRTPSSTLRLASTLVAYPPLLTISHRC